MKLVSWNVNGLRACMGKGFLDFFHEVSADIFCVQEIKLQSDQIVLDLPNYRMYWNYAVKKGYSGTAIFTRQKPLSVQYGMEAFFPDEEGRLITLEFPDYYIVTVYTPNAQRGLARIAYRLEWEKAFCAFLLSLEAQKSVIICGDMNVAHKEIDLINPQPNRGNAGFSDEERAAFSSLLACGFTDTYRALYPTATGAYTWWSYMYNARANNAGWRIDYVLTSNCLASGIQETTIYSDVLGSDHCPVGLVLDDQLLMSTVNK